MARVAKIDNAFKRRLAKANSKRLINFRQKLVYFLVVCEGEKTEPNYFKSLQKNIESGKIEIRILGTGLNTLGVVRYAIEQRKLTCRNIDRVWVVFDKDDFSDQNFNDAIELSKKENIGCAWSNEAFELWFVLHFQLITHAMKRHDYSQFIEREVRKLSGQETYLYKKNDPGTYELLIKFGSQKNAILNAKKLKGQHNDFKYATHNPYTNVFELVEELMEPNSTLKELESR